MISFDKLAVVAGGISTGTAFYISFGQIPAFREFGLQEHWRSFPYIYKRTANMQYGMTIFAGITSIVHGVRIIDSPFYRNLWIIVGSTFLGMIPFTSIFISPTDNIILEDNERMRSGNESEISIATKKNLLDKWEVLNLVQTISSFIGFTAMIYGFTRSSSVVY